MMALDFILYVFYYLKGRGGKMALKEKSKQLITYISKRYIPATVTSLMKLCYLVDLIAVSKTGKQISDFQYKRYKYGPFDQNIYAYLDTLTKEKKLLEEVDHTPYAEEYIVYRFNEHLESGFDSLAEDEKAIIDSVLDNLRGLGAKALAELSYKTKPMRALGAKINNDKGINQPLNLKA